MEVLLLLLALLLVFGLPICVAVLFSANGDLRARLASVEQRLDRFEKQEIAPAASVVAEWAAQGAPLPESTWSDEAAPDAPEPIGAVPDAQTDQDEPEPEALPEDAPPGETAHHAPAPQESMGVLFERLVAGKLLIWLGGIALVVAAIFLIRYSIEVGLITPAARMVGAGLFGLALLGAGEYARRGRFADDPRIAQALVGAGIAVLYATVYGSNVLYGLLDNRFAFGAMAAVTALALGLSLRHGAPTAIMGLVGGFLTPILVGERSASAVPLLTYLALLDLGLFLLAWRRGWTWLAAAATLLSFAWTLWVAVQPGDRDPLLAGGFVVALAIVAATFRPGAGRQLVLLQPLALGIAELALLVGRTDLGAPAWGLFAALSLASLILAGLRTELRLAPLAALLFALALLAIKAVAGPIDHVPMAAIGITILFGLGGLTLAWARPGALWAGIASLAFFGPDLIIRIFQPDYMAFSAWGALAAALTLGPAALIWLHRRRASPEMPADLALLFAGGGAALLAGAAVWDLAAWDWIAAGWLGVALVLALGARRLNDLALGTVALVVILVALARAFWMVPELSTGSIDALLGMPVFAASLPDSMRTLTALAIPAALLVAIRLVLPPLALGARRALPLAAGLFAIAALYIWFKQAFGLAYGEDFIARGLIERTIITQALFATGWLLGAGRLRLPRIDPDALRLAGTILTASAAARLIWFDMVLFNPAGHLQWVGPLPVLNLILPQFLLGAAWLYLARRRAMEKASTWPWLAAFLLTLCVGVALLVRQYYHGAILAGDDVPNEAYGYSLAFLLVSIGLIVAGVRLPDKALRIAGLVLLTATIVKVFLVDASALTGLLRILSFLVLGIVLIGIGRLYGPILRAEREDAPLATAESSG
jgi:uncharacterized membrane protein